MQNVYYRNLGKMRTLGPSYYAWSVCSLSGNVGRGKKLEGTDGEILSGTAFIQNVTANVQLGTLRRIREQNERAVAAWLIGTRSEVPNEHPRGTLRRITLNPFKDDCFKYSDDHTPVQFPCDVLLTIDGAYAVKN